MDNKIINDNIFNVFSQLPYELSIPQHFDNFNGQLNATLEKYQIWFLENRFVFKPFIERYGFKYEEFDEFIKILCAKITEIISIYPNFENSYDILSSFLDKYFYYLYNSKGVSDHTVPGGFLWNCSANFDENNNRIFYRVRKKNKETYSKEELFHVPFSQPNKVTNDRYSIPLKPSLYLSETLKCCKEEIGYPYEDLVFSAFRFRKTGTMDPNNFILNFAYDFKLAADYYHNRGEMSSFYCDPIVISYYLLFWPVIIACNVKKHEGINIMLRPVEYFIPNILYKYLSIKFTNSIIGIRYYSTKLKSEYWVNKTLLGVNFAFSTEPEEGHSYDRKLLKLFDFSEPLALDSVIKLKGWDAFKINDFDSNILNDLLVFG